MSEENKKSPKAKKSQRRKRTTGKSASSKGQEESKTFSVPGLPPDAPRTFPFDQEKFDKEKQKWSEMNDSRLSSILDQVLPGVSLEDHALPKVPDNIIDRTGKEKSDQLALIASMYQHSIMDCVVDAAFAVSEDFARRPDRYRSVEVTLLLVLLRRSLGILPFFPEKMLRMQLYLPFFGNPSAGEFKKGVVKFSKDAHALMLAAKAYSENKLEATEKALADRVKIAASRFRACVEGLLGSALEGAFMQTAVPFEVARNILMDEGIRKKFDMDGDFSNPTWPVEEEPDFQGAILIESIFAKLNNDPEKAKIVNSENFINLQLIAAAGSKSILNAFLDLENESNLAALVSSFYTWGSELGVI